MMRKAAILNASRRVFRDTTGVLDQGMSLKGELGNTGEPDSFLVENTVNGVPPERKTPGAYWYSHL